MATIPLTCPGSSDISPERFASYPYNTLPLWPLGTSPESGHNEDVRECKGRAEIYTYIHTCICGFSGSWLCGCDNGCGLFRLLFSLSWRGHIFCGWPHLHKVVWKHPPLPIVGPLTPAVIHLKREREEGVGIEVGCNSCMEQRE